MSTQLYWTTDRIREVYLEFFRSKGHKIVSSDSLVPQGDPTLLFTGAGMNQFKDYFLGIKKDMTRATSSQKCLRTGDLDNVGRTPYHHSFFEMLGNFSFGDYFKEEAITWAMEILSEHFKIPRERLRVSVHLNDEEAFRIWKDKINVPEKWISKLGDKSNFWPANAPKDGPNGPCGPCSEIFYDQGEAFGCGKSSCSVDCDCGRFAEIWNLVFTQFDRQDEGVLTPLKAKNIDTGGGLERFACMLQGKKNNFEIDILQPLVDFLYQGLKAEPNKDPEAVAAAKMVIDHARAATFTIADGITPSNEGRGYVVRKLIRRCVWKGRKYLFQNQRSQPFLHILSEKVSEIMAHQYPYLKKDFARIQMLLKGEEERFLSTLDDGYKILEEILKKTRSSGQAMVSAEDAFRLYDTFGFPDELTATVAQDNGLGVDFKGFEKLMEEQRKRAQDASKIADTIFTGEEIHPELAKQPGTQFLGYETLQSEGKVLFTDLLGAEGWIVLDKSPFYAEKGGQVGDKGRFIWKEGEAEVEDTQCKDKWILHRVVIRKGQLKKGEVLRSEVNEENRDRIRRHHTATHILQAALRKILGTHVRQLGSLVNPEKLRFDFSHPKSLTSEEISAVESFVNSAILSNLPVLTTEMSYNESQDKDVLSFFGEKYEDKVRVLDVGNGLSRELCGGTHVSRSGDIGSFFITAESSIASGTRRIEAVAGMAAVEYAQRTRANLERLALTLKTSVGEVVERVVKLQEKVKELQKQGGGNKISQSDVQSLAQNAQKIEGVHFICQEFADIDINSMRGVLDQIRSFYKNDPVTTVLFSTSKETVSFLASSTSSLVDASRLAKEIANSLEGSGGGKKDFAQGGSKRPELLPKAKENASRFLEQILKK